MPLTVIGTNHRTAPVEVRERFSYRRGEIPAVLAGLLESGVAEEAALLSTCNRTEFYLSVPDVPRAEAAVRALMAERAGHGVEEGRRYLYVQRDRHAVKHLFSVAAGLDSMVLGEPQIQGQVREAYETARTTVAATGGVVGTLLNRLFQQTLSVGGRVRTETELGQGVASVSSAAVELAKKIFGSLSGRRALVLGAGEMSEVTLECLRGEGVRSWVVANRTFERAQEVAERWGGRAIRLDDLEAALPTTDIVICSTAAPHPVITRSRVRAALPGGARRPLCIIDIAIPRDVEPAVGDEPNVFLYNIDDLQQIVEDNLDRRRAQLPRADEIVAEEVEQFWSWYAGLAVVPTIRDLRAHGEAVRQAEVEKALRRLGHLPEEDLAAIEAMSRAMLNKLLHAPTVRLREAAGNGRGTSVLDTVRYLFHLDHRAEEETQADGQLPHLARTTTPSHPQS